MAVQTVDEIEREARKECNGLPTSAARNAYMAVRLRALARKLNERAEGFEKSQRHPQLDSTLDPHLL